MNKHFTTIAIFLTFFVGLSVMLYPPVAGYFNAAHQSRTVAEHYLDLEGLDDHHFLRLFEEAKAYNEELPRRRSRFTFSDKDAEEYAGLLNPTGNGIMGTLAIDKINVKLPIYHGTSESVLQKGTGHFEGTSLPIGGPGTHSVITGHRGLPSSTLLTRLDRMALDDTFVLRIMNEVLTYKIDMILVVDPYDLDALEIEAGKDYVTLITCTPYSINSHRLLLRGVRTVNSSMSSTEADGGIVEGGAIAALLSVPVLILIAISIWINYRKIYGKRRTQ